MRDRTRVREHWIETGPAADDHRGLHELFEEQAVLTPDATAVVFRRREPDLPRG